MSEANKKQLMETLTALNREEQVWAINFLVQNLAGISARKKRLARKLHDEGFDDEQWEAYFQGEKPINLPQETEPLSNLLKASAGKTIKPIEKWL
jgi:hypothetical protein